MSPGPALVSPRLALGLGTVKGRSLTEEEILSLMGRPDTHARAHAHLGAGKYLKHRITIRPCNKPALSGPKKRRPAMPCQRFVVEGKGQHPVVGVPVGVPAAELDDDPPAGVAGGEDGDGPPQLRGDVHREPRRRAGVVPAPEQGLRRAGRGRSQSVSDESTKRKKKTRDHPRWIPLFKINSPVSVPLPLGLSHFRVGQMVCHQNFTKFSIEFGILAFSLLGEGAAIWSK